MRCSRAPRSSFLHSAGAALPSSTAQAGPLSVAPRQDVAPAALTETVQYGRRGVRAVTIRPGVRYARGGYYYRRGYNNTILPGGGALILCGCARCGDVGRNDRLLRSLLLHVELLRRFLSGLLRRELLPGLLCRQRYYPAYYGGGYYRTRRVVYRNAYGPRVVYRNAYGPRVVRYRAHRAAHAPDRHAHVRALGLHRTLGLHRALGTARAPLRR